VIQGFRTLLRFVLHPWLPSAAPIGAGAGAAIGAAGGGNDNGFDKIDHAVTAGLAVLGAAAGAVGGYLIGKRNKRVLIYQAK